MARDATAATTTTPSIAIQYPNMCAAKLCSNCQLDPTTTPNVSLRSGLEVLPGERLTPANPQNMPSSKAELIRSSTNNWIMEALEIVLGLNLIHHDRTVDCSYKHACSHHMIAETLNLLSISQSSINGFCTISTPLSQQQ